MSRRVLVADGHIVFREACRNYLTLKGFEVDSTPNPEEALVLIKNMRYGLILIGDFYDKGNSLGISTISRIRESDRKTPIIIQSTEMTPSWSNKALRNGANYALFKDASKLLSALKELKLSD